MKKIIIFAFIIFHAFLVFNANATTWYVRPVSGEYGAEDGTTYATAYDGFVGITWGAGGVVTGDTLYVCGTFPEKLTIGASGSDPDYITIRGDYGGDPGIIEGDGVVSGKYCVYLENKDWIYFRNLSITTSFEGIRGVDCTHVIGHTLTFSELGRRGWYFSGSDSDNYAEYIEIYNSSFTNIGAWGDTAAADINITWYSRRTLEQGCTHIGNGVDKGVDCITFAGETPNIRDLGSQHYMINNTYLGGYEENAIDFKAVQQSAAGEERSLVQGCYFTGSYLLGTIIVHQGSREIDFIGNYFEDTTTGILVYSVNDAQTYSGDQGYLVIKNNIFDTIDNYGVGVGGWDTSGYVEVYNNTFAYCGYTVDTVSGIPICVEQTSPSWTIKNNIFYRCGKARDDSALDAFAIYTSDTTNWVVDYNTIWHWDQVAGKKLYLWGAGVDYTLAEMRDNTVHSDNDLEVDPLFTDFHLLAGSPCIWTGTDLNIETDYDGLPFHPTAPSRGAREYRGVGQGSMVPSLDIGL